MKKRKNITISIFMYTVYFLFWIISLLQIHKYKITWLKESRVKKQADGFESSSATECLCYF